VFDSSGPDGKVRGTPQQIIEKYNQLARDAQLSHDRVAAENFQQHAEHYLRLLGEAQKELDAKRDQDAKREQQERDNRERQAERDRERAQREDDRSDRSDAGAGPQPDPAQDRADSGRTDGGDSTLVETPEGKSPAKRAPRKPRQKPHGDDETHAPQGGDQGSDQGRVDHSSGQGAKDGDSGEAPKPKQRRPRKPKAEPGDAPNGSASSTDTDTAAE